MIRFRRVLWLAFPALICVCDPEAFAVTGGKRPRCEIDLVAQAPSVVSDMSVETALETVAQTFDGLGTEELGSDSNWIPIINNYLLPAARSASPSLVVTLVGATNVGKSQVFNSLLAEPTAETAPAVSPSPVSFDAESTARPVIMVNSKTFDEHGNFDLRFAKTERWRSPEQVSYAGPALVFPVRDFFSNLIFIDTPAYSTLRTQTIVNEEIRISDIIFYVFSNTNYAEPNNIQFLKQRLIANGPRDVVLIYNVNAGISPQVAQAHFESLRSAIMSGLPNETLPINVLGQYHMVHREEVALGHEKIRLDPVGESIPFAELLAGLEQNSANHRRQVLNMTLKYVLDRAQNSIACVDRLEEELNLSEKVFEGYLNHLIRDAILHIPYGRLAPDLERAYYRQTTGFKKFSQWLANPLNMSGLFEGPAVAKSPAVLEIERYLDSVIEKVVAEFRLGVAEGTIRIPVGDEGAAELLSAIDEFHNRFPETEERASYLERRGVYEIRLPHSPQVERYFSRFLGRNWHALVPEIQNDVRENFSNLILQVQSRLEELSRKQGFRARFEQGTYTTLAILPAVLTVSYMAYRGTAILEIQTLASIFGAHLAARFFVNLNERSFRRGWATSVRGWLEERQEPRLVDILRRHIRLRPTDQKIELDREKVREAMARLEFLGIGTR